MRTGVPLEVRRRARGVTLIEVLVTMVITAVGLLGLAGMQVRGLSIQKDAHGRSLATQLALDIADRMRSNVGAVASYTFANPYSGTYTPPIVTSCRGAICTAAQQAQFDFQDWFKGVRNGALPGGWATITPAAGSATAWDVTLMWVETGFRSRPASQGLQAALPSTCPAAAAAPPEVECVTVRVWP